MKVTFYKETQPKISLDKIICYGEIHSLPSAVHPTCFIGESGRAKYILEHVPLPAMLNSVGFVVFSENLHEWIFVEDSLSSIRKLFSLSQTPVEAV